ncbi:MAG: KH domain-containing protein [Candidatus Daviesbacteria bacterium]|nr:KH domain-containing protein [Candidatus Daviesbacteria bacterium]
MKDLLNFIVTNLVTKPEAVSVEEQKDNENINLNLTVDPTDMGLIIGKNGQTIRAIRKLLTVRAMAENIRVNLQLTEPQEDKRNEDTSEESS